MGLVLAALAFALYGPTADYPFVFDDQNNIRDNRSVHAERLDGASLWRAASSGSTNRPVAYVSFAVDHAIGGLDPAAFRRTNVAIHALCAWLVYLLVYRLVSLHARLAGQAAPRSEGAALFVAALAAGIFVAHPLQTQSVTYIVQRMSSLSALFTLVALLAWFEGRVRSGGWRGSWWAGAAIAWGLALCTKETAVVLPALILLVEWFLLQDLDPAWLRRHATRFAAVGLVGVALGALVLRAYPYGYELYGFGPGERMLSELRVLWRYLALVFWPVPGALNLGHEVAVSRSLLEPPTTLLAGLGLLALFAFVVAVARRRRLVAFSVLWFFATLALESSFLPIELMYEHRLYLPMLGPALLVAHVVAGVRGIGPHRFFSLLAGVLGLGIVALLVAGTAARNPTWRDETTLWSDVVAKSPHDARAWNNLGSAHEQEGRLEEAVGAFREAAVLDADYERPRANLGIALHRLGHLEEALVAYDAALVLAAGNADTRRNRASALLALGRLEAARDEYQQALRLDSRSASAHYGMGATLARLGRWKESRLHLDESLRLDPRNAEVQRLRQAVGRAETLGLEAPSAPEGPEAPSEG